MYNLMDKKGVLERRSQSNQTESLQRFVMRSHSDVPPKLMTIESLPKHEIQRLLSHQEELLISNVNVLLGTEMSTPTQSQSSMNKLEIDKATTSSSRSNGCTALNEVKSAILNKPSNKTPILTKHLTSKPLDQKQNMKSKSATGNTKSANSKKNTESKKSSTPKPSSTVHRINNPHKPSAVEKTSEILTSIEHNLSSSKTGGPNLNKRIVPVNSNVSSTPHGCDETNPYFLMKTVPTSNYTNGSNAPSNKERPSNKSECESKATGKKSSDFYYYNPDNKITHAQGLFEKSQARLIRSNDKKSENSSNLGNCDLTRTGNVSSVKATKESVNQNTSNITFSSSKTPSQQSAGHATAYAKNSNKTSRNDLQPKKAHDKNSYIYVNSSDSQCVTNNSLPLNSLKELVVSLTKETSEVRENCIVNGTNDITVERVTTTLRESNDLKVQNSKSQTNKENNCEISIMVEIPSKNSDTVEEISDRSVSSLASNAISAIKPLTLTSKDDTSSHSNAVATNIEAIIPNNKEIKGSEVSKIKQPCLTKLLKDKVPDNESRAVKEKSKNTDNKTNSSDPSQINQNFLAYLMSDASELDEVTCFTSNDGIDMDTALVEEVVTSEFNEQLGPSRIEDPSTADICNQNLPDQSFESMEATSFENNSNLMHLASIASILRADIISPNPENTLNEHILNKNVNLAKSNLQVNASFENSIKKNQKNERSRKRKRSTAIEPIHASSKSRTVERDQNDYSEISPSKCRNNVSREKQGSKRKRSACDDSENQSARKSSLSESSLSCSVEDSSTTRDSSLNMLDSLNYNQTSKSTLSRNGVHKSKGSALCSETVHKSQSKTKNAFNTLINGKSHSKKSLTSVSPSRMTSGSLGSFSSCTTNNASDISPDHLNSFYCRSPTPQRSQVTSECENSEYEPDNSDINLSKRLKSQSQPPLRIVGGNFASNNQRNSRPQSRASIRGTRSGRREKKELTRNKRSKSQPPMYQAPCEDAVVFRRVLRSNCTGFVIERDKITNNFVRRKSCDLTNHAHEEIPTQWSTLQPSTRNRMTPLPSGFYDFDSDDDSTIVSPKSPIHEPVENNNYELQNADVRRALKALKCKRRAKRALQRSKSVEPIRRVCDDSHSDDDAPIRPVVQEVLTTTILQKALLSKQSKSVVQTPTRQERATQTLIKKTHTVNCEVPTWWSSISSEILLDSLNFRMDSFIFIFLRLINIPTGVAKFAGIDLKSDSGDFYIEYQDDEETKSFYLLPRYISMDHTMSIELLLTTNYCYYPLNISRFYETYKKLEPSRRSKFLVFTNVEIDSNLVEAGVIKKTMFEDLSVILYTFCKEFDGRDDIIHLLTNNDHRLTEIANEFLKNMYFIHSKINVENENKELIITDKLNIQEANRFYERLKKWTSDLIKNKIGNTQDLHEIVRSVKEVQDSKHFLPIMNCIDVKFGYEQYFTRLSQCMLSKKCVVVAGITGIGKTDLVKKCLDMQKGHFKYIVWINGEDMQDSVMEAAKFYGIQPLESLGDAVKGLCQTLNFNGAESIIVFDSVTDMDALPIIKDSFLTQQHSVSVVVTSTNVDTWKNFEIIHMQPPSHEECTKLFSSFLNYDSNKDCKMEYLADCPKVIGDEVKDILNEMSVLVDFLPLALHTAASCCNADLKSLSLLKNENLVAHTVRSYNSKIKKFIETNTINIPGISIGLMASFEIARNKIIRDNHGDMASTIMEILACSGNTSIHLESFLSMMQKKGHVNSEDDEDDKLMICRAANLLNAYGLINVEGSISFVHPLFAELTRLALKKDGTHGKRLQSVISMSNLSFSGSKTEAASSQFKAKDRIVWEQVLHYPQVLRDLLPNYLDFLENSNEALPVYEKYSCILMCHEHVVHQSHISRALNWTLLRTARHHWEQGFNWRANSIYANIIEKVEKNMETDAVESFFMRLYWVVCRLSHMNREDVFKEANLLMSYEVLTKLVPYNRHMRYIKIFAEALEQIGRKYQAYELYQHVINHVLQNKGDIEHNKDIKLCAIMISTGARAWRKMSGEDTLHILRYCIDEDQEKPEVLANFAAWVATIEDQNLSKNFEEVINKAFDYLFPGDLQKDIMQPVLFLWQKLTSEKLFHAAITILELALVLPALEFWQEKVFAALREITIYAANGNTRPDPANETFQIFLEKCSSLPNFGDILYCCAKLLQELKCYSLACMFLQRNWELCVENPSKETIIQLPRIMSELGKLSNTFLEIGRPKKTREIYSQMHSKLEFIIRFGDESLCEVLNIIQVFFQLPSDKTYAALRIEMLAAELDDSFQSSAQKINCHIT